MVKETIVPIQPVEEKKQSNNSFRVNKKNKIKKTYRKIRVDKFYLQTKNHNKFSNLWYQTIKFALSPKYHAIAKNGSVWFNLDIENKQLEILVGKVDFNKEQENFELEKTIKIINEPANDIFNLINSNQTDILELNKLINEIKQNSFGIKKINFIQQTLNKQNVFDWKTLKLVFEKLNSVTKHNHTLTLFSFNVNNYIMFDEIRLIRYRILNIINKLGLFSFVKNDLSNQQVEQIENEFAYHKVTHNLIKDCLKSILMINNFYANTYVYVNDVECNYSYIFNYKDRIDKTNNFLMSITADCENHSLSNLINIIKSFINDYIMYIDIKFKDFVKKYTTLKVKNYQESNLVEIVDSKIPDEDYL